MRDVEKLIQCLGCLELVSDEELGLCTECDEAFCDDCITPYGGSMLCPECYETLVVVPHLFPGIN